MTKRFLSFDFLSLFLLFFCPPISSLAGGYILIIEGQRAKRSWHPLTLRNLRTELFGEVHERSLHAMYLRIIHVLCTCGAPWTKIGEYFTPIGNSFRCDGEHVPRFSMAATIISGPQ